MTDEKRKRTKKSMVARETAKATAMLPTKETIADGQILANRYRVIEKIGAGAMGMVYKVADQSMDEQIFAIKVLPPEAAGDEGAVERLKKEAQSAINLNHPHIMGVNYFEAKGETKFIVMEYLDGPNLDVALARQEKFTEEQVIELAQGLCPALDYAHERKIIHRDIKPANLIYTTEGDKEIVKLADFGIAFRLRETMTKLTGQGSTGTLLYVPPEQLAGMATDGRSDQYSLAVTFFELLSGEAPFRGPTEAITEQIKNGKAQPIKGVSDHVNKAILRAMAKDPQARFDSCADFLAALQASAKQAASTTKGQVKTKPKSWLPTILFFLSALAIFAAFKVANVEPKKSFIEKLESPKKRALAVVYHLDKKDFKTVRAAFTKNLLKIVSLEKLQRDWKVLRQDFKKLKKVRIIKTSKEGPFTVFDVDCVFDQGNIVVRTSFDQSSKLSALLFKKVSLAERNRSYERITRQVASLLVKGKFKEIIDRGKLRKGGLTEEKLARDWKAKIGFPGSFIALKNYKLIPTKTDQTTFITFVYEGTKIEMKLHFDIACILHKLYIRNILPPGGGQ